MYNIANTILRLVPKAKFSIKNNEIIWNDERKQPTEKQIQKKMKELQDEYDRTEYQRLRKAEYTKLNQDELRFDDMMNGTETWKDAILAIKEKYPKQEQGDN